MQLKKEMTNMTRWVQSNIPEFLKFTIYMNAWSFLMKVIQRHSVPATASLAHDYSQTFESYKLSEYTDYKIQGCADIGTECHMYYIEDEYRRVAAEEIKRKIRENGMESLNTTNCLNLQFLCTTYDHVLLLFPIL